mgnify:CR=1 FL=1
MKRLIAAALLLVFIAAACLTGWLALSSCSKKVTPLLSSAEEAARKKDFEMSRKLLCQAESQYARSEWALSFFVDHTLVEQLGEQIAELPPLAKEESKEELLSHIAAVKTKFLHISRDSRFSVHNIF